MSKWYSKLHPEWSELTRIGRVKILQSSYFWVFAVPLLAKTLSKIPHEIHIPFSKDVIIVSLELPFTWAMFYFSSIAFAIATFVYSLSCPRLIRDYENFSDFEEKGGGSQQIAKAFANLIYRSRRRVLKRTSSSIASDLIEKHKREAFVSRFVKNPAQLDRVEELYGFLDYSEIELDECKLRDAFWYVRVRVDKQHRLARTACSSLYTMGFALIFIVISENCIYVIKTLL